MSDKYLVQCCIVAGAVLIAGMVPLHAEMPQPAIHIKHESENETTRSMLRLLYKQCVSEKELYLDTKNSGHAAWPAMEKSLNRRRKKYDVDAPLADEPDWSAIAIDREEEYFYGEKYAVYKQKSKYSISKDGRCDLISKKKQTAQLDNGQFQYNVNFTKGIATKRRSAVLYRKDSDKMIRQTFIPGSAQVDAMKNLAMNQNLPNTDTKGAQSAIVAGQKCTYAFPVPNGKSKLCYWSVMSHYPSTMEHPVILKSVIFVGKTPNIKQAVSFTISESLEERFFKPPENIKIKDRSL